MTTSRALVVAPEPLGSELCARSGPYRVTTCDSIIDVDSRAWQEASAAPGLFLDPRFIRVVEETFARDAKFRHLLLWDQRGLPIARASLSVFRVDTTTLGGPKLKQVSRYLRKVWPSFGFTQVSMCGLPVSLGDHSLGLSNQADAAEVVRVLNDELDLFGRQEGASVAIFKEFDQQHPVGATSLQRLGYRSVDSPATHVLEARFAGIEEYCAALRAHYRNDVRRSFRKFKEAELSCRRLRGAAAAAAYNDELHRLYLAVVEKAQNKLEILSPSFFRGIAAEFGDAMSLTLIEKEGAVLAFNCSLLHGDTYHFLFCGMDYAAISKGDVYFNLMFKDLDHGLREGVRRIRLGQASESFKARVGCDVIPLQLYIKGRGLWSPLLRLFGEQLFPARPAPPSYKIFKT